MKLNLLIATVLPAIVLSLAASRALADVRLPGFFGDSMVLQQGIKLPVWGFAAPGEQVTVAIAGQKASATADKDGNWRVTLEPLTADGKGLEMTVTGKNAVVIKDVLVGEVWLCGGQSNMLMEVGGAANAEREIAAADLPQIRHYQATRAASPQPQHDHHGSWSVASPKTVGNWTAVGFFFARDLHKKLGVPVGIINTSLGGMPISTFMSIKSLRTVPDARDEVFDEYDKVLSEYNAHRAERDKAVADAAEAQHKRLEWLLAQDKREENPAANAAPEADVSAWTPVELPLAKDKVLFPEAGIYWLRRQVEIPKEWLNRELQIGPLSIADSDQPYLNGQMVDGGVWVERFGCDGGRWYLMKSEMIKDTKLTLGIRILNVTGKAGLQCDSFALAPREMAKDEKPLPLKGQWLMRQAVKIDAKDLPVVPEAEPPPGGEAGDPEALYNSGIFPLAPYALRGAIWYQGEGHYFRTHYYSQALPALIKDWRDLWGQGDFPFGIVQLPNYMAGQTLAIDHGWPELREVQYQVSKSVNNAGIVVTLDLGEGDNAHPRRKKEIGDRLALWALANVYGKGDLAWSSPIYKSMKIEGDKIRVTFDHTAGGLRARGGGDVTGFAIAGADKVFHLAKARADGDSVVVWSDKVKAPVAVRYAWANNPVFNLFNKVDLPAMPFRTDDWDVKEVKAAEDELITPAGDRTP